MEKNPEFQDMRKKTIKLQAFYLNKQKSNNTVIFKATKPFHSTLSTKLQRAFSFYFTINS